MNSDPQHYTLTRVVFYVFIAIVFYLLYRVFEPFLVPLCWAAVMAVCVHPLHVRLARRFSNGRAATLTTLLVTLLLVLPVTVVATELGRQALLGLSVLQQSLGDDNTLHIPLFVQTSWNWAQQHLPLPPVAELKAMVSDSVKQIGGIVAARATGLVGNVAVFLLDLMVTLFALLYFLRDAGRISDTIRKLLPFPHDRRDRLITQTRALVAASVSSSLTVASVQGLLGGLTFLALGISGALFWGILMAALALLPAIGTALVWVPTALWLMATDEVARGCILLAVGVGVIGSVDNVLRPILLSGHSRMNGLITFISLIGGVSVFGFVGLVLGPVLVATAMSLLEAYLYDDAHQENI